MLKIAGSIDAASPTTMSRHQFNSAQWNADIGLFAKSATDFDDKESAFGDGIKKSFLGVKNIIIKIISTSLILFIKD